MTPEQLVLQLTDAMTVGERQVQALLKQCPDVVEGAFFSASNFQWVKPEFALGNEFRTDWVAVYGFSGGYNIHLIELESPTEPLYTKAGLEGPSLRRGRKQRDEWADWIRRNEPFFRRELGRALKDTDDGDCSFRHQYVHQAIADIDTHVNMLYQIVAGRRAAMTPEDRRNRDKQSLLMSSEPFVTYDRLLDRAKLIAEYEGGKKRRE